MKFKKSLSFQPKVKLKIVLECQDQLKILDMPFKNVTVKDIKVPETMQNIWAYQLIQLPKIRYLTLSKVIFETQQQLFDPFKGQDFVKLKLLNVCFASGLKLSLNQLAKKWHLGKVQSLTLYPFVVSTILEDWEFNQIAKLME